MSHTHSAAAWAPHLPAAHPNPSQPPALQPDVAQAKVPQAKVPQIDAAQIVERLTHAIRRLEDLHQRPSTQTVSTGCPALDQLLPGCGLRRGTLVEWLAGGSGSGAVTLALIAAREACRQGGLLAVLDAGRTFYPPAAAALHVDLTRLLIVRPRQRRDESWALDQLLRSRAVGAVLAWPADWQQTAFRRLQLAAETGQGLGLLLRPEAVRHLPSWAELRLRVEPQPAARQRRWRLEILRIRGAYAAGSLAVELDESTGKLHETRPTNSLPLASPLAARTLRPRSRPA